MRVKVGIREAETVSVVIFSNQGDNMCKNVLKGKCEKWQLASMINRTINVKDSKWYNLHCSGQGLVAFTHQVFTGPILSFFRGSYDKSL